MRISDWSSDVCSSDLVTLGNATTAAVQKQIASLGTNILQVRPGQGFGRGGGGPRPPEFKPEDVAAIEKQVTGVTEVAPQAQTSVTAIYKERARVGEDKSVSVRVDPGG